MTSTATTGLAPRGGAGPAPGCIGRIGAWCYDHRRIGLLGWIAAVIAIIAVDLRPGRGLKTTSAAPAGED